MHAIQHADFLYDNGNFPQQENSSAACYALSPNMSLDRMQCHRFACTTFILKQLFGLADATTIDKEAIIHVLDNMIQEADTEVEVVR